MERIVTATFWVEPTVLLWAILEATQKKSGTSLASSLALPSPPFAAGGPSTAIEPNRSEVEAELDGILSIYGSGDSGRSGIDDDASTTLTRAERWLDDVSLTYGDLIDLAVKLFSELTPEEIQEMRDCW